MESGQSELKLAGRGILITGASQGLGRVIARVCVSHGAHVSICGRNAKLLEETASQLRALAGEQKILASVGDVAEEEDAARLIRDAARDLPGFCGLVNNAGVAGPKGLTEDTGWAEWRRAIEINLFGTVMLCRGAARVFREGGYGKIVNLSGGGATAPMPRLSAYAASKAAVVRFTETLAGEVGDARIDVNAVAPGALNTAMLDEIIAAGPEKAGDQYHFAMRQKAAGGASIERAAELVAHLLSAETDGISGKLISAVWDPWERLAERKDTLMSSDIYTLRRIVPADRGQDWE